MAETLKSPVSTTDDFEPLLVSEDEERAPRAHEAQPPLRRVMVTACYCLVMVVNGGMCGAFGPSLEYFERSTGLSQAVLGGAVMQNRLAKLAGTVLWGWYASSIQQQRGRMEMLMPPHQLMAAVLLVSAACSATLGFTRSGAVLQIAMVVSGFMYGVSDSAANLLVIWVWDYDPRKLRINVAVLNAMFTIGAFVTPMLIAASIHFLKGHVWPAYYVLAFVSIVEACLLPLLPSPPPPRQAAAKPAAESDVELDAVLETASLADTKARSSDAELSGGSLKPSTASKAKRLGDGSGWFYLGDPGTESLPRHVVVMVAICTMCFFANGLEHATATWLPAFGIKHRGLGEETMAIMASNFWTAMSLGRLAWACLSGAVTSAWPSLFMNTLCCIASGLVLAVPSNALLWSSAMGIGLGVASSFPASVTLPPELGVQMTPRMMTTLQLCASFGEMLCPFIMGIAFQMKLYSLFYILYVVWELLVLVLLSIAWLLLTRRIAVPAALLRRLP